MKKVTNKKKSTQVSTIEEELKKQVFTTEEEIKKYELIRIEREKELCEIASLSNPVEKVKRTLAIYKKYDSYTINERKRGYRRAYNFIGRISDYNNDTPEILTSFFSFIPDNGLTRKELRLVLKEKGLKDNEIRWKINRATLNQSLTVIGDKYVNRLHDFVYYEYRQLQ